MKKFEVPLSTIGVKRKRKIKQEGEGDDTKSFLSPNSLEPTNHEENQNNWLKRWRSGDKIFKGHFSSGITPKITRPIKRVTIASPRPLFQDSDDEKEETHFGINPFIEITPQCPVKSRAISFNHPEDLDNMCVSPKNNSKPKQVSTPTPIKTIGNVTNSNMVSHLSSDTGLGLANDEQRDLLG